MQVCNAALLDTSFLENKYFTLLAKQGLTRNSGNLEQGPAYGVPGGLKT